MLLIFISLRTNDAELFKCFSGISVSSFENSVFKSAPHFLTGLFVFLAVQILFFFNHAFIILIPR